MIKSHLSVLMAERGLNISDLSKATGLNRNTLSSLYNNEAKGVQFETLDKLTDYFGVDVDSIISKIYGTVSFIDYKQITENSYRIETQFTIKNVASRGWIELEVEDYTARLNLPHDIIKPLLIVPSAYKSGFLKSELVIPLLKKFHLTATNYRIEVLNSDFSGDHEKGDKYIYYETAPIE